jgi:membrane associated rhomboid family serine protease
MPETNRDVSHHVVLACANKGAEGFYPRVDGVNLDIDRSRLDATLDMLRLGGFVEIADWTPQKGQGYRITDAGRQAALRPELLTRPAAARSIESIALRGDRGAWDKAEEIRRAVLNPPAAIATRILIAINVAVYLVICAYNLQQGNTLDNLSKGFMLPLPGPLVPLDFYRGEWWLLFTYSFLHGSPLHIGMNMFCLYTLGNVMEGRWGWKRFLILYFGSGLIGGVAVLLGGSDPLHFVRGTVGASGAIAGLLTSLGVWAWMHRRYLPPQFVEAHFRMVGLNLLILIGSGFMPNISMAAHVGGALGGAVVSVPLAWLGSMSPPRHRVIGVITLLLIAGVCVLAIEMAPRPDFRVPPGINGFRLRQR